MWGFKIIQNQGNLELDKSPTARISKTRAGTREYFRSTGAPRRDSVDVQSTYLLYLHKLNYSFL